jgi:hypothetical protein
MAKGGMLKHLSTCSQRQTVIAASEQQAGAKQPLYQLRAQDAWRGDYWLDLEMRGSATLKDLDYYLRAIWLECCGHLSQFSIGGWRGREIAKKTPAAQIFEPGVELTHIYDFGTSSETLIKVVAVRDGKPTTSHPLALMARNLPPEAKCMACERPASWLCIECMYEENAPGLLCDEHAQDHPHDNYGEPMPLVNSPRVGMCGYTGPAEPPYSAPFGY